MNKIAVTLNNYKQAGLLLLFFFFFTGCKNDLQTRGTDQGAKIPGIDTTVILNGQGIVSEYGQLRYEGIYLLNEKGRRVSLEGMSLFWHQWEGGKYYNYDCLKWLRDDWHCDIIRAAIAVERGGYLEKPEHTEKLIFELIESCIDLDLYVLVDWHSHEAEKAPEAALEFFTKVARRYGDKPNVIYEIYNEPLQVDWTKDVKPYLDTVVSAIRNIDPDNIIILGTTQWSQNVDSASLNPVDATNIAYTLHYYAGTHQEWLRKKAQVAIDSGIPLWVSEFGMCNADGDGPIDYEESQRWFDFMEKYGISWCKWSVVEKSETSAALQPEAGPGGGWSEDVLTESGKFIRDKIRKVNPRR
ncbi:MAG: glycoside hydrolase family 5 protein [Bacteroidales bacterium]|nr:glycoside hydrolase family 5 protein [Bacteroidales bacterium]